MAGGHKGHALQAKLRGNILTFPVKIATAIYRGTLVAIDAAGYLIQAGDGAAMKFVGIAEESCTAAEAVADGTKNLRVRRHGIFRMTKNTTSAVTDVGKLAYAHTTHTDAVDELVGLANAATYDNCVGLIVRREPDTPGGSAFTLNYLMVDITPSPWSTIDLSTHIALADQNAHVAAGIGPSLTTETITNPTTTALEFFGGIIQCTYAGAVTIVLPSTGVDAGTLCRIVKANGTAGLLGISATTLVGPQCTGNAFVGCGYNGDSVLIECVGADSYRIVDVCQQTKVSTEATGTHTLTAVEFLGGIFTETNAGAGALTLPASGVPIGAKCLIEKLNATVGLLAIGATTLVGPGCNSNFFIGCGNNGDSVLLVCVAADSYRVVAVSQERITTAVDTDTAITAAEFIGGVVTVGRGQAQATTLPTSGVPINTVCTIVRLAHASANTLSAGALIGGASSGNSHAACDAIGDAIQVQCTGDNDYQVIAEAIA